MKKVQTLLVKTVTVQVKWSKTKGVRMSRPSIAISLTVDERKELEKQIRQTKGRKKADRLRVILYKAEGHSNKFIAKLLQIGRNQVSKLLKRYCAGGLAALLQADKYQGAKPKLTSEQQQALKIELKTKIYATAFQVIAWVEEQWGVVYELSAMHKLLKRLGFSYKKNRLVPSKADPELQRLFVRWFEWFCAQLGPDDRLYFGDAVHFKHNAEAGYAWSVVGEPHRIPSNTGRQRYNVFGAYCIQTHEHIFMLTEDNINKDKLAEFLPLLHAKHSGQGKIYLMLDNASYNRAHKVKDEALKQNIVLDYLPPYSPNLNPIERLWKFVRKKFFKDKYRDTFDKFCQQLDDFFANLDQYHDELASLLTDNFELVPEGWQTPVSI
jgi:transposase